jgi:hypothetical protein
MKIQAATIARALTEADKDNAALYARICYRSTIQPTLLINRSGRYWPAVRVNPS